jgi:transposase
MKPLKIADSPSIVLGLQDEIRRSDESRYDHRLHGVLLVAQGMTCPEVATLLGDSRRSVEYWVHRFETRGLAGLQEGARPGRPGRLTANLWDGRLLAEYLRRQHGIGLGVRQCQRLFRQLGFRLRKPRPLIAHADLQQQAAVKKTPQAGRRARR